MLITRSRCKRRALALTAAATAVTFSFEILPARSARGAAYTWISNTSSSWSVSSNWIGGVVPLPGVATSVFFSGTGTSSFAFNAYNNLPSPFDLNLLFLQARSPLTQTISGNPLRFVSSSPDLFSGIIDYVPPLGNVSALTVQNDLILTGNFTADNETTTLMTLSGVISGHGKFYAGNGRTMLTGANTYTGGTQTGLGHLIVRGAATTGTGPVQIGGLNPPPAVDGGVINYGGAPNVASGDNSVTVTRDGVVTFDTLDSNAVAKINPASNGVLALLPSQTILASFALTGFSGRPNLRLGTWIDNSSSSSPGTITFSSNFVPGGTTYRFGGAHSYDPIYGDTLKVTSNLTDGVGGVARGVRIEAANDSGSGGRVILANTANSYSGGTVVAGSILHRDQTNTLSFDFTPVAGQTPLGTGPLSVYGALVFEGTFGGVGSLPNALNFKPGSELYFNDVIRNGTQNSPVIADRWPDSKPLPLNGTKLSLRTMGSATETVGAVTYADGSIARFDNNGGPSTLTFSLLSRIGRGTLRLETQGDNSLGASQIVDVLNGAGLVDAATGMVHPSVVSDEVSSFFQPGNFVQVGAGGRLVRMTYVSSPNPAVDNEVLAPGTPFYLSNDEKVWAARLGTSTISAGKTLSLGSGGLILYGPVSGGTILFGTGPASPAEGIVFVSGNNTATVSSNLNAAAGLTKFGEGDLLLSGSNTISGGLTINEGYLGLLNSAALPDRSSVYVGYRGSLGIASTGLTVSSLAGAGIVAGPGTFTVDTDADLTFDGSIGVSTFVKAGSGSLTVNGWNQYNGPTVVLGGTLTLNGGNSGVAHHNPDGSIVWLHGDYSTSPGASLRFGADHEIAALTGSGDTYVLGGVKLTAASLRQNRLDLAAGARVSLLSNGTTAATSRLNVLSLAGANGAWQGSLDLADNDLIIDYDGISPLPTVRDQIITGFNHGTWNGNGIISSVADATHRLGYLDNAARGLATFSGQSVDPTSILIKFTYAGDANLDGQVDVTDLGALATNWQTSSEWSGGDFNYDGLVDVSDLGILATNWQAGVGSPLAPSSFQAALAAVGLGATSVPEPSVLCSIAAGLLSLCPRSTARRRGRWRAMSRRLPPSAS